MFDNLWAIDEMFFFLYDIMYANIVPDAVICGGCVRCLSVDCIWAELCVRVVVGIARMCCGRSGSIRMIEFVLFGYLVMLH